MVAALLAQGVSADEVRTSARVAREALPTLHTNLHLAVMPASILTKPSHPHRFQPACHISPQVGVICFYRAQVGAIRRALQQADAGGGSSRAPGEAGRGGTAAGGAAGAGDQQDGLVGEGGGGRDSGMVQVATVDSFQVGARWQPRAGQGPT